MVGEHFGIDAPECRERMGGNRRDQVHVSGRHDWQVVGRVAWPVCSSWENEVSNKLVHCGNYFGKLCSKSFGRVDATLSYAIVLSIS